MVLRVFRKLDLMDGILGWLEEGRRFQFLGLAISLSNESGGNWGRDLIVLGRLRHTSGALFLVELGLLSL